MKFIFTNIAVDRIPIDCERIKNFFQFNLSLDYISNNSETTLIY
jgi:hypothetical protein